MSVGSKLCQSLLTDVIHFRRAFDKFPYYRVTARLKSFGVQARVCRSIDDYVRGGPFTLRILDSYSNRHEVDSGVSQGPTAVTDVHERFITGREVSVFDLRI